MTEADLDFLTEMLGHPEVMEHYPKPLDRAEARDWLARVLAGYARAGYGFWVAELRETAEPVGQIGLLAKDINGRPEVEVTCWRARSGGAVSPPKEHARAATMPSTRWACPAS